MPDAIRTPRVLLIEDEPGDAQLIRWQLLEKGPDAFDVRLASSLTEAEALIERESFRPDVILLDLNLPDSTGVSTVTRCRERLPDCPVVVLTGLDDQAAISPAIEAGAEDYLAKGADGAVLRKAIRYAMLRHGREAESRLAASVFSHAREGILIAAPDGSIIDVNDAFCRITGYSREEAVGNNPRMLKSGHHDAAFYQAMWTQLLDTGAWEGEVWNRRKDGGIYPELLIISAVRSRRGPITHFVALFTDITVQKQQQERLQQLAHFDALTELPNRVLLADRLRQAMSHARRTQSPLAVAYIDLDGFKAINDQHGHDAGDHLLRVVALRMRKSLRDADTLARLGGDEFVAVIGDLSGLLETTEVLERLLVAASRPVEYNNHTLQVSASCGVTFFPQSDADLDADQLLRQADQAMYEAKQAGKNRYHFFNAEQDEAARDQHSFRERLRAALQDNELALHYQPKVNLRSGAVVGAEALVRWPQQDGSLLYPGDFLPCLDGSPLALELDDWVLKQALAQMCQWRHAGITLPVSVNIGAQTLQRDDFAAWLGAHLARYPKLPRDSLILEIVESSALDDLVKASRIIRDCAPLGVAFALDDFGTGYSSLTYLKTLPASELKIDQSFVRGMLDDPENMAIIEGVLGLAIAFQRNAVSEGVETIEHGIMLARLGCETGQGYAIAHPMPASEIPAWLAGWQAPAAWRNEVAVNRDDLHLLFAEVEHRAWIERLVAYLRGQGEHPAELDAGECRFGRWLARQTTLGPNQQAIVDRHAAVHRYASELLARNARDGSAATPEHLNGLYARRDALIEALHALYQATSASG
ncbi:MAG: EAL domain-containing protein [Halothiobacillaceae bacterium]|nr:EAL domain-containing protein [Halothiobacillaceae bacterium]